MAPRGARRLLLLAILALLVHVVHGAAEGHLPIVETWIYGGASAIAVVLGLWRVVARRDERLAWGFVTFGLACALLGDAAWTWLVPVAAGAAALSSAGVVPSLGAVTLGLEADSASAALRLADERMSAAKRTARSGPASVSLPA